MSEDRPIIEISAANHGFITIEVRDVIVHCDDDTVIIQGSQDKENWFDLREPDLIDEVLSNYGLKKNEFTPVCYIRIKRKD